MKLTKIFMAPISIIVIGFIICLWAFIVVYSKVLNKDETIIEKKMEEVIEKNIENVLSLPSGSLEGKLDFMVQPLEPKDDKN
jgi:hypothetical protein